MLIYTHIHVHIHTYTHIHYVHTHAYMHVCTYVLHAKPTGLLLHCISPIIACHAFSMCKIMGFTVTFSNRHIILDHIPPPYCHPFSLLLSGILLFPDLVEQSLGLTVLTTQAWPPRFLFGVQK